MKNSMQLILINTIKRHERTLGRRVANLVRAIKKEGCLKRPIIVDKRSLVILDGHHRVEALRQLGATHVPAHLVDYQSAEVRVYLRRKYLSMDIIKQAVLYCGTTGRVFPVKTTRHVIGDRFRPARVPLSRLLL